MELARRAARGAQVGARHFKPVADITGALAGTLFVAGGYAAGAFGSMGLYGIKSAGAVIGSAIGGEASDAEESGPTPSPLAVPTTGSSGVGSGAVPAYLQDRDTDEYRANAKKASVLGQFASREQDSRRKKQQELEDKRQASRRDAEEVIRRNLG